MKHGGGPDETRRFGGSAGDDSTRRYDRPAGGDETQRLGGPGGPDQTRRIGGQGGADGTRRMDRPDGGGQVVGGRYLLEGLLGAGGMADVHRATDQRLNRPVAVKIFRPGTDPDGERRFHGEAQVLANLSHPSLVAVHDFGVEQHRAYLVMELVDGPTLREVLDRGPMPLEEVTRIGTDVADVLAYVHDQGVVHRDVKPSNVLLGRQDGRVRLADFGISQLIDSTRLTSADTTIGTASYMAPEQLQGGRVGTPADVYALGLVLLEAVTGRVEYPGGDWEAAAERVSRPPEVPNDLPEPLRHALVAMTENDPAARPTAAQAAEMLAEPSGEVPVDEEEPPPSRTGRNLAIVLGLAAVIAVIAAVALAGGDDTPDAAAPPSAPVTAPEAPPVPPEAPPAEEPAPEEPPPAEEPAPEDPGAPGLPGAPTFDPPDLPDLPDFPNATDLPDAPDLPEGTGENAENAWDRFVNWVSSWF